MEATGEGEEEERRVCVLLSLIPHLNHTLTLVGLVLSTIHVLQTLQRGRRDQVRRETN
jgi:hypothetical protein